MRVLALVPNAYDTAPAQRFRIEQWERHLNASGIDIFYGAFESAPLSRIAHQPGQWGTKSRLIAEGFVRRMKLFGDLSDFDLAYVCREITPLGPAVFERVLHRRGLPFVFDFDDAIFLPAPRATASYFSLLKYPQKTATSCRLAAHVLAGNSYLADYARQFNPDVSVVPTTIDLDKYRVAPSPPHEEPVIGWTGSHSTFPYLAQLLPVLRQLAARHRFRLRVIGASFQKLEGLESEVLPWRASTEVEDIRGIDIGIMPLPDDPWTRGKCALKALQYMALAIPTVCSPVGVNSEIIQHGENGFLASTNKDWIGRLSELLRSPELRVRLGTAGRETVERRFDGAAQARNVAEILRSVCRSRAVAV